MLFQKYVFHTEKFEPEPAFIFCLATRGQRNATTIWEYYTADM